MRIASLSPQLVSVWCIATCETPGHAYAILATPSSILGTPVVASWMQRLSLPRLTCEVIRIVCDLVVHHKAVSKAN